MATSPEDHSQVAGLHDMIYTFLQVSINFGLRVAAIKLFYEFLALFVYKLYWKSDTNSFLFG